MTPRAPNKAISNSVAPTKAAGCTTGASVSGRAIAARAIPISNARNTPPIESPRFICQARIGAANTSFIAVAAGLKDRAGVVRVGGLGHRHRDQARDDEFPVGEALDLVDPSAKREAEDEDE